MQAYPILFDDDAPSECKTENLDAQILVIKGTRKVVNGISVVKVIKIVKETNKIENNMEVNSQEKPCFVKSQKHESSAPPIKNLFRRKWVKFFRNNLYFNDFIIYSIAYI